MDIDNLSITIAVIIIVAGPISASTVFPWELVQSVQLEIASQTMILVVITYVKLLEWIIVGTGCWSIQWTDKWHSVLSHPLPTVHLGQVLMLQHPRSGAKYTPVNMPVLRDSWEHLWLERDGRFFPLLLQNNLYRTMSVYVPCCPCSAHTKQTQFSCKSDTDTERGNNHLHGNAEFCIRLHHQKRLFLTLTHKCVCIVRS